MAKKKATRKVKKKPSKKLTVPKEQWKLPVACNSSGAFVTLEDVAKAKAAALSFAELAPAQQAELVAERIRKTLQYVPPEKLVVTPDCGFSQTARWASRAKLKTMVKGAEIVRKELTG